MLLVLPSGIKRLSPAERAGISIPNEVKEILVGLLLGDAIEKIPYCQL